MKIGIYKHYKGGLYEVLGIARHSETLEEFVLYKSLKEIKEFKEKPFFVRPKGMFFEEVVVDNKKIKRFEFLGDGN